MKVLSAGLLWFVVDVAVKNMRNRESTITQVAAEDLRGG